MNPIRAAFAALLLGGTLLATPGQAATPVQGAALARGAMHAAGFTLGRAGPLIVAFEDPNCRFCHLFSTDTQALLAQGRLRIRVVPVAFLKPDSKARAAAILQAPDPARAWQDNESGFDVGSEEGGYPPAAVKPATATALERNLRLLESSGEVLTPSLMICERGQAAPTLLRGVEHSRLLRLLPGAGSITPRGGCSFGG
jgi:thiol:disulfide interchange protein DsbG